MTLRGKPFITPFCAAALVVLLLPAAASADVAVSQSGEVIRKFYFNADTGVQLNEDGTVRTAGEAVHTAVVPRSRTEVIDTVPQDLPGENLNNSGDGSVAPSLQ